MKKTIFTLVIALGAFAVINAQTLTSKKGVPILPEAGEYGLGINATPFFSYAGNMFNGSSFNPGPSFNFTANNPLTIYGKYFIDAHTAYRAKFQIGYTSVTDKNFVTKDAEDVNHEITVEDKANWNHMMIALGLGIEKRRGKGRVQGIYGAEATIMFGSSKETYEYGNTWNPDFNHHVTDFGDNLIYENGYLYGQKTEVNNGSSFGLDIRGFVGVEYFFAPKISLGGEFGWGILLRSTGEGEVKYEFLDYSTETGEQFLSNSTTKTGGGSTFGLGVDNLSGAINLMFYF